MEHRRPQQRARHRRLRRRRHGGSGPRRGAGQPGGRQHALRGPARRRDPGGLRRAGHHPGRPGHLHHAVLTVRPRGRRGGGRLRRGARRRQPRPGRHRRTDRRRRPRGRRHSG
ncbi:hypothetical protein LRS74_29200 [Streptomyces sp. LX-29]|nr:hypothetical protein LRS74_29200 [Streptomyces sp. LX-29]